jgi:5'(3')-deoxyribonucleotidase
MFDINNLKNVIEESKHKAKIKYLMTKHDIDLQMLQHLIKTMSIYLDYDEVLVDLNKAWLLYYNKNNNTDYVYEDIDKFYWWDTKPNGLDFLEKEKDCYKDVKPRIDVENFFEIIKNNNMIDNISIATFSYPRNILSKFNNIRKYFPFISDRKVFITGQKWDLNFNHAIMIEDGANNATEIVSKNPYAYILLLDTIHNKDLKTGNRIKRIESIIELFDYLPLLALENYNRHHDINKLHLYTEFFKKV